MIKEAIMLVSPFCVLVDQLILISFICKYKALIDFICIKRYTYAHIYFNFYLGV